MRIRYLDQPVHYISKKPKSTYQIVEITRVTSACGQIISASILLEVIDTNIMGRVGLLPLESIV